MKSTANDVAMQNHSSASSRVVLILQARMGSTRLPGKSMMDLAGAPLVARILERVKRCRNVDEVVLSTTQKPEDDVLFDLAKKYSVACFRGSENDLVDRYHRAAQAYNADVIVRIPADNVTPEPEEVDRIISYHLKSENAFSSNLAQVFTNGYPDGIGAEVVEFWALEEVSNSCNDAYKREHPHLNFFDYATQTPANPLRFPVGTVTCPEAFRRPDLVLDVNTLEQYNFCAALYADLYPQNRDFHITDTIAWYDSVWRAQHEVRVYTADSVGERKLTFCFDIDGTICVNTDGAYAEAEPFPDVIAEVNRLYDAGHRILLNTARGGTTGIDWMDVTRGQMQSWGVRYHELIMAKPTADVFIDDRSVNAVAWRNTGFRLTLNMAKNGGMG